MSNPLNFKSAGEMSVVELAVAFNAAFEGYFYPPNMTAELLARRMRIEQIDIHHSLVAYDGKEFVGFALMAIRGEFGWCGGFGITPEHRGHRRAGELMSAFLAEARRAEVKRLSLEVLTRNTVAKRLYERAGMKVSRDLLILERSGEPVVCDSPLELREAAPLVLLRHFSRLHLQPPAWQRDLPSLLVSDGVRGFYLGEISSPDAYALSMSRDDGVTYLIDLASADAKSAHVLSARIAQRPGMLRVINEPQDSLFITTLRAYGFVEKDRQHEMISEQPS
jgi:GNAT superfamily N-acetyltransferase